MPFRRDALVSANDHIIIVNRFWGNRFLSSSMVEHHSKGILFFDMPFDLRTPVAHNAHWCENESCIRGIRSASPKFTIRHDERDDLNGLP